jgi:hypothetical protein
MVYLKTQFVFRCNRQDITFTCYLKKKEASGRQLDGTYYFLFSSLKTFYTVPDNYLIKSETRICSFMSFRFFINQTSKVSFFKALMHNGDELESLES